MSTVQTKEDYSTNVSYTKEGILSGGHPSEKQHEQLDKVIAQEYKEQEQQEVQKVQKRTSIKLILFQRECMLVDFVFNQQKIDKTKFQLTKKIVDQYQSLQKIKIQPFNSYKKIKALELKYEQYMRHMQDRGGAKVKWSNKNLRNFNHHFIQHINQFVQQNQNIRFPTSFLHPKENLKDKKIIQLLRQIQDEDIQKKLRSFLQGKFANANPTCKVKLEYFLTHLLTQSEQRNIQNLFRFQGKEREEYLRN